nr:type IV secretion system protein [uncultured Rhodopila sp.]
MDITPYFTFIWTSITTQEATANAALIGALQGVMSGWFVKLVPTYLVIQMFIAMWSGEEAAELRFWKSVLWAALIYQFVAYLPYYQEWVSGVVNGTMQTLTAAVIGGGGASVPDSFSHIATKCFSVAAAMIKAIPDAATYAKMAMLGFAVVIYIAATMIIIGLVFSLYLLAFVVTNYLLGYGPVFIVMLYFEQTSQFFDGWFRSLVAGMLVQLFLIGDLAMMTVTMNGFMALISPVMNPTGTAAATGDIGFMLWDMFGVLIVMSLFVLLAGVSVYLAVTISGGAHHQLVRRTRPGGSRIPSPSPSGGSGNRSGGSVQPSGSAGGAAPPPSYAFQRTTPMNGPSP